MIAKSNVQTTVRQPARRSRNVYFDVTLYSTKNPTKFKAHKIENAGFNTDGSIKFDTTHKWSVSIPVDQVVADDLKWVKRVSASGKEFSTCRATILGRCSIDGEWVNPAISNANVMQVFNRREYVAKADVDGVLADIPDASDEIPETAPWDTEPVTVAA